MSGRLEGKVALITGGTSGIGEASVELFVKEGAKVVFTGRNADKGAEMAKALGANARFFKSDISDEAQIKASVDETVKAFGRMDVLFNNAGGPTRGEVDTVTHDDFRHATDLLLGSVIFGIRHAAPVMKAQGTGAIINNASVSSNRTHMGEYLYSIMKAGVVHATLNGRDPVDLMFHTAIDGSAWNVVPGSPWSATTPLTATPPSGKPTIVAIARSRPAGTEVRSGSVQRIGRSGGAIGAGAHPAVSAAAHIATASVVSLRWRGPDMSPPRLVELPGILGRELGSVNRSHPDAPALRTPVLFVVSQRKCCETTNRTRGWRYQGGGVSSAGWVRCRREGRSS